ncbi:hypothetical protein [Mucilaginibacter sp.]
MSTQEVAEKLVAYCREGKNIDAINELYADGIVSRECKGSPQELSEGKKRYWPKIRDGLSRLVKYMASPSRTLLLPVIISP